MYEDDIFSLLLPAEKEALLEALRRDLRSEKNLAMLDSDSALLHKRNVQLNLRLLEALNPKAQVPPQQCSKSFSMKLSSAGDMQTIHQHL
jgi:hypothetical protein